MTRSHLTNALVFLALVAIAVASRMVDAAPNFAGVAAVALFAGFFFATRLAVAVPLAAMLISDSVIGFYDPRQMAVVYAMLSLPVMLRGFVAPAGRPSAWRVFGSALLCSGAFFLVTNLAVWTFGSMYTHDFAGFLLCYTNAIAFLRYTVASDLAFSIVLFGVYALATRGAARRAVLATA